MDILYIYIYKIINIFYIYHTILESCLSRKAIRFSQGLAGQGLAGSLPCLIQIWMTQINI
jgi:hypothetical protein